MGEYEGKVSHWGCTGGSGANESFFPISDMQKADREMLIRHPLMVTDWPDIQAYSKLNSHCWYQLVTILMSTTQLVLLIFLCYQHCPPLANRHPPSRLTGLDHLIRLHSFACAPLNSCAYARSLVAKPQCFFFFFLFIAACFGVLDYAGATTIQIVPDLLTARH